MLHSSVIESKDCTNDAVAVAAIDCTKTVIAATVEGRADSLSFLDKRARVTSRLRILSESVQLGLWLQLICWCQELVVGDLLAVDPGVKLAFLGCVGFRQMRRPSIDPDLDLVGGQACCIDDGTVREVRTVDSVWVHRGKARAAVKPCQLGKVLERIGSCDNRLNCAVTRLVLEGHYASV